MFGKRKCSLCGGKLVDNKCTLCGLDNSKSDENYKQTEIRVNDPEKRESEPEQLKNHQEKKKETGMYRMVRFWKNEERNLGRDFLQSSYRLLQWLVWILCWILR